MHLSWLEVTLFLALSLVCIEESRAYFLDTLTTAENGKKTLRLYAPFNPEIAGTGCDLLDQAGVKILRLFCQVNSEEMTARVDTKVRHLIFLGRSQPQHLP